MREVDDGGCAVLEEVRYPTVRADTDAIVWVDAMAPRGGREAVGTVAAIGAAVTTIEVGDRVLVSSINSCGTTQTELVRVACADTSTCKIPDGVTDGEILSIATFVRDASVGILN